MISPDIKDLMRNMDSRYTLVVTAAKRARQLTDGAEPLTRYRSDKPVTLAIHEIAEGKVDYFRDAAASAKAENKTRQSWPGGADTLPDAYDEYLYSDSEAPDAIDADAPDTIAATMDIEDAAEVAIDYEGAGEVAADYEGEGEAAADYVGEGAGEDGGGDGPGGGAYAEDADETAEIAEIEGEPDDFEESDTAEGDQP